MNRTVGTAFVSSYQLPVYTDSSKPQCDDIIDDACDEDIVDFQNVTVKFRISDTQVVAQVYPNRLSIADLKKDVARKFEVKNTWIVVKQCNKEQSDKCLLLDTNCNEFGIHEFTLELRIPPEDRKILSESCFKPGLDINVYYKKQRLADFITVHIPGEDTDDGMPKNIVVEIQNKAIIKPFLCGYRDKATGIEYLDAFTQTGPYFDKWKYRRYISRDSQTYEHREQTINTMHDHSTQCFLDCNNILYVSAASDVTIIPRKYQTYEAKMRQENKLAKVKLIQRNWRRYLAARYIAQAAAKYRRLVANRIAADEAFKQEAVEFINRENRAKQFPTTKADFDLLLSEVQSWKIAEMKRITKQYEGAERVVAINVLLDKEIKMLNGIERQRQLVNKALKDFRDEKMLTKLGQPIKWIGYKDTVIHLDLLRTQRVRFLHEIYKDMQKPMSKAERIELLGKVRLLIVQQERDFPDFGELYDLIDREKNLLLYTQYCDPSMLRKRINAIFMDMIKYAKEKISKKGQKHMCEVCKKVKPIEAFALRSRQNLVNSCKACYYLSASNQDAGIYNAILRSIQREERKKRCTASYAFVMQVDDIRLLITQVWHSHSILSKSEDLRSLRLPRWVKSDDWAPWNCICLTADEARNHYIVDDLKKVYDEKIRLEIRNRNMLARNLFSRLASVSVEFLETGQWFKVGLNQQRDPIEGID